MRLFKVFLILFAFLSGLIYFSHNPVYPLKVPEHFPELNSAVQDNYPTKWGVKLGEKLFHEAKLSVNQKVSCASCHDPARAFSDSLSLSKGVEGRLGLRNAPSLQNLAFLQHYNWDGNILHLEKQGRIPVITYEEMDFSLVQFIERIRWDLNYRWLFLKAFGEWEVTAERVLKSLAQYQYTLISAESRYDKIMHPQNLEEKWEFTPEEKEGYLIFQQKCESCHSGALFTDQSFRNKGFPHVANVHDPGRARVSMKDEDWGKFRVPSLRNLAFTAPYGSQGQFKTLRELLDFISDGVEDSPQLDVILKDQGAKIPLTETEKSRLISFLNTLNENYF